MREIKFRAWDKRDEEMYTPTNIMLSNSKKVWIADKKVFNDMRHLIEEESKFRNIGDSAILMQFIGLKDKKGKEIYEGDIVIVDIDIDTKSDVGIIEFVPNRGCYECVKLKKRWDTECGEIFGDLYWHSEEFKIIGNIYENPELLEDRYE